MPDLKQFLLPDVGEGLTEAEIIKWDVAPGDTVTVNQTLVEIETAKAAVELPSPYAGVVTELHVAPGDTVDVGRPIITIDTAPGGAAPGAVEVPTGTGLAGEGRQAVLVGYGPKADGPGRRRSRVGTAIAPDPGWAPTQPEAAEAEPVAAGPDESELAAATAAPVLAKPPVRLLAKNLGVDLAGVVATGPNGTVSREDVEQAAQPRDAAAGASASSSRKGAQRLQRETRMPVRGVRKHTAAAVSASAFTAPHVTVFHTADVSATMELRERIAVRREFAGVKVSPLVLLAKAVMIAAAATPEINASWDEAAGEIVVKHYVNLGIAAATPRGLLVPNIKDADQLGLRDLAIAIGELTATARAGTTTPADLAGGTITITNIGVFGVDTGTPILNPGESGIVAFGAVARRPWVVDEQIVPRWVTTLAVSFDHRIVDGQQGAQFLSTVAGILGDPGLALL
jgi:2-oxoisovalerate dehydrogenase E2 component (dihydrolipoyl transacylase)